MQPTKAKLIKTNFSSPGRLRARALLTTAIALPLALGLVISPTEVLATTLPTGGNVVGGTATISTNGAGTVETINQSTQRAVINWNTFNLSSDGTVQFNQPNSGALALNRVTGSASASQINGIINANGGVWVINPNGVMIGATGQVNANSFVATTGHVKTSDFMSGASQIQIKGMNPNAEVANAGTITVADAGMVALVGAQVANYGTINANLGRVQLAGGRAATLDFNGDGMISIDAASTLANGDVIFNSGEITADGGIVQITAAAAKTTLDNVLNIDGVVQARGVASNAGKIILTATGPGKSKIGGNNPGPNNGRLDANNAYGTGGNISINGNRVALNNSAFLDVDGAAGGGTININATTYPTDLFSNPSVGDINVAQDAILTLNTNSSGQGGKATLVSDGTAEVGGTFLAHGFPDSVLGSDGTLQSINTSAVSISAEVNLEYNASADLRPFGPGAAGTLTLSTPNLTVGPAGNPGTTLTGAKLGQQLDLFGNVKLDSHNVTFDESVHSNSANSLTTVLKDGFKFILGIPVAESGQLVFNQDVSLKNLTLQSPSADGIDVSGGALPNLHVTNLTLDAPANFEQTPILGPNTVTVSSALGNEGRIQQGMDVVATGGTVFLDSNKITSAQDATVNNAFTLTGFNPYNFDSLTINNPGLIVTYNAGVPSVTANTVNLNADNPVTHLLQTAYDMASGATGVFIPTLNLGLTQYLDDLNYYNEHVAVLGVPNLAILNSLTLSSSSAFIGNVLANDVYDNAASGQQGYDLVATGGRVHYGQSNYGTLFVYDDNITLLGALGGSAFNDIHLVTASDTFNNITTDWVGVHVTDATLQGTDLVNLHGQVHYYFDNALNTTLDLNRDINLYGNGLSGQTTFGTLTLNTTLGSLTNILGNVVNDNQGAAQRGYNVTAENGILNLSQSGYAETLDADTAGVTVNGAPGTGTALDGLTMDAINSFNGITTSLINVNVAHMAQKANDMVNSGGVLNFAGLNASPETLTLNRADITLNGAPLGGTIFDTLNVNAMPTLNNIFGNNVNSNTGPAMYSVNATATGGTDNLSRFVYAPEDLTVDRDMTVIGINPVSVFKRVFNNASATLIRIAQLEDPNGSAKGLTPVQSNLNGQLPPSVTPTSLEALLSSLAPAGPDAKDNEGLRLCITKSADAANACIADVLAADGNTAVDYKITSDRLTEPKDTLMNVRNISRDDLQRLLDGGLDI